MSTRAQVRFATRETGQSFNEHPDAIHAQFYKHHDGYPEGLGMDIAESISMNNNPSLKWEIEELQTQHGDLEYIYYIWQGYDKDTSISIFEVNYTNNDDEHCYRRSIYRKDDSKCIFVGTPGKLINKYKLNTNDDG